VTALAALCFKRLYFREQIVFFVLGIGIEQIVRYNSTINLEVFGDE
jgi:hypothetical protein